jgi:hypothetical protein
MKLGNTANKATAERGDKKETVASEREGMRCDVHVKYEKYGNEYV